MSTRTVFFISDSTGITAETFGNAIIAQFDFTPRRVRIPFIDTADKAYQAVRQINLTYESERVRPIVFSTMVNPDILAIVSKHCDGLLMDMFETFLAPIEAEVGMKSHHRIGRFGGVTKSEAYNNRIEAINFSLAHDDGQSNLDLQSADV
ncbi:MAG: kinase/pyrophosphorylase, partial [Rhodocyclaceae bacterium]|nr:kinase/pyrophosphorylase [Rhodocyclaceae bacterium]